MILNISFSNHRSFRDDTSFSMEATASQAKNNNVVSYATVTGEMRLLKSAVIFGANASGKTNIIRLVSLLVNEVRQASGVYGGLNVGPLYTPFCLDDIHTEEPATIDVQFLIGDIIYDYKVKMNRFEILEETLSYSPNGYQAKLFERIANKDAGLHMPKYPTTLNKGGLRPNFSVFPNRLILSKFLYDTPHELIRPAARFLANINVANSYNRNMRDKMWQNSLEWMSEQKHRVQLSRLLKFADLGVYKFEIDENTAKLMDVFLYHNGDKTTETEYSIPYSEESLGTQQLFILGTKILQSLENGTPLFIDEVDSGFHTYLSEFILELFNNPRINKKNAQLITTTHDINLMNEDRLRRDQVWFTSKADDGASELYSLSDFDGVREDTPFAKWYLANKFGAVPNIDSIEDLFDE